jgi:uncharacterized HhH-GPD family protein
MNASLRAKISGVRQLSSFSFSWPQGSEEFESGWEFTLDVQGQHHQIRHGLGSRVVYGRPRVHTVTWLDRAVQVEGVEADDYPTTRALLSLLRKGGSAHLKTRDEVPKEYSEFEVVEHRREIEAKWSRHALAVKIREDDLLKWGVHAWLRHQSRRRTSRHSATASRVRPRSSQTLEPYSLPAAPTSEGQEVVAALLGHGETLANSLVGAKARFTPDEHANALIHEDPFAFLVAVISDQGILAERAWAIPYALVQRLGHLDPKRFADEPGAVREAFEKSPKLHRFVDDVAGWTSQAGRIVARQYGGDARRIWNDTPSAAELRSRFDEFPGIGQKKAAMAVEILERDLHVPLTDLSGSDIAYDVHVRRVFMRTGLALRDDVGHMVAIARKLYPERPGALDNPAWDVGRRWCHRAAPDCVSCPLLVACPRLVERGDTVRGI